MIQSTIKYTTLSIYLAIATFQFEALIACLIRKKRGYASHQVVWADRIHFYLLSSSFALLQGFFCQHTYFYYLAIVLIFLFVFLCVIMQWKISTGRTWQMIVDSIFFFFQTNQEKVDRLNQLKRKGSLT